MDNLSTPDIIGLIGIVFVLLAYVFLQLEWLKAKQLAYSLLNGIGAALIIVSLVYDFNLPSFIIEVIWVLISIFGIVKAINLRKSKIDK